MENKIRDIRTGLVKNNKEFLKDKLYMEFGVHSGKSLLQFYNLYKKYEINGKFYGFDSFLGLPEEKNDVNNPKYWPSGEYSCKGDINKELYQKDITIVDGWFNETLTDEFAKELIGKKIGIIHVDCDIYTSAYECLDFCFKNNLVDKGTIIVYDDWGCYHDKLGEGHEFEVGEGLAHTYIMEKYNIECIYENKHIILPGYYEVAIFKVK
jgi:hypothetical protein